MLALFPANTDRQSSMKTFEEFTKCTKVSLKCVAGTALQMTGRTPDGNILSVQGVTALQCIQLRAVGLMLSLRLPLVTYLCPCGSDITTHISFINFLPCVSDPVGK